MIEKQPSKKGAFNITFWHEFFSSVSELMGIFEVRRGRIFIVYQSCLAFSCLIVRSFWSIKVIFFQMMTWLVIFVPTFYWPTEAPKLFFQFDTHWEDGGCLRWWLTVKKITSRFAKHLFTLFSRDFLFSCSYVQKGKKDEKMNVETIDRKNRPSAPKELLFSWLVGCWKVKGWMVG